MFSAKKKFICIIQIVLCGTKGSHNCFQTNCMSCSQSDAPIVVTQTHIFSNISSFSSLLTEYVHFIEEQAEERVTRPGQEKREGGDTGITFGCSDDGVLL